MKALAAVVGVLLAGTALAELPDLDRVNGSISIDANQKARNLSTVNGSIRIGEHAMVAAVSTVNGPIVLGNGATTASLSTVNGGVTVGAGAHVSGDASTVNGSMALEAAADLSGSLSNVNGSIRLAAAHVGHGIETASGNIEIGSDSRVEGGVLVRKVSGGWLFGWFPGYAPRLPLIVIGPHAIIQGPLKFERPVKLYVSDQATVGPIEGAKAVIYSGAHPACAEAADGCS